MPQPSEARTKCVELAQQLVNDYYEKSVEQAKNKSVSGSGNTTYAAPVDTRATDVHSVADELYSWYSSKSDEDAALAILETSFNLADEIWQQAVDNVIYKHVFPLGTDGDIDDDIAVTRSNYTLPTDNRVADTKTIADARYKYIMTGKTS